MNLMQKRRPYVFVSLAGLIFSLACQACNLGDAPSGPSQAEYQKALDQMTPEQKIKWIQSSPLNPDKKEKEIAAIKQKAGLK